MPAVSPGEAKRSWDAYIALKQEIAEKNDIQKIGNNEFYKKSYWRKTATFFNLSVEIIKEDQETIGNNIIYNFTCRATAPNARFSDGSGSCDLMEKGRRNSIHNTRATAETRAYNRAVSNLVGGGEVSAEEVNGDDHYYNDPATAPLEDEPKINQFQIDKLKSQDQEALKIELEKLDVKAVEDLTLGQASKLIKI